MDMGEHSIFILMSSRAVYVFSDSAYLRGLVNPSLQALQNVRLQFLLEIFDSLKIFKEELVNCLYHR